MSKQTKLTIGLVVVFAGLAGAMGWQYWKTQTVTQQASVQRQFVADFSIDAVNIIELTTTSQASSMSKDADGKWVYDLSSDDTVVPDDAAVKALLNTVHDSTIQATLTTSTDQASTYGLDEANKTHIILKIGNTNVADVMVGKAGKPTNTWYGNRTGDNTTYLLSGSRSSLVNDKWKFWKPAPEATDANSNSTPAN